MKTRKFKRIMGVATAASVLSICIVGTNLMVGAEGETVTSDYTLTIPATLAVANKGWNALEGGISAKGTLESGKKLVVTPTSENSWNLVANKGEETESKVGYNLATTGDNTSVYSATAEVPTWEFTELTADGTSQTAGIVVDDYSEKPAGTYTDTVTFTASVETAKQLHSFTLTGPYTHQSLLVEFYDGDTWSDMVAKYSLITNPTKNYVGFSSDGFINKNDEWVTMDETVDPNATYTVE